MGLSAAEISDVQTSWTKVYGDWANFGNDLFVRLFKKYPDITAAFSDAFDGQEKSDPDSLKGNTKMKAHLNNFKGGLNSLVESVSDADLLQVTVQKLAKNHVRRNLEPEQFSKAFDELTLMLSEDKSIEPGVVASWKKALDAVLGLMTTSMAEIRSS